MGDLSGSSQLYFSKQEDNTFQSKFFKIKVNLF